MVSVCTLVRSLPVLTHAELLVQVGQWQQFSPQTIDGRAVNHLDTFASLLAFQADELQKADLRNRIPVATACHHEGGDDSQCQRNLYFQGGSMAWAAMNIYGAADFFDVCLDDV